VLWHRALQPLLPCVGTCAARGALGDSCVQLCAEVRRLASSHSGCEKLLLLSRLQCRQNAGILRSVQADLFWEDGVPQCMHASQPASGRPAAICLPSIGPLPCAGGLGRR
jgi:hypothetical protein